MVQLLDQKVCWNCEESIHEDALNCPYCGVTALSPFQKERKEDTPVHTVQDFEIENKEKSSLIEEIPLVEAVKKDHVENRDGIQEYTINKSIYSNFDSVIPFLLIPGVIFFLFSLMLFFFSKGEELTLSWNRSSWPFYFFISLPFVYYGWNSLKEK